MQNVQNVQKDKELEFNKGMSHPLPHLAIKVLVINRKHAAAATHLQRSGHVGLGSLTDALLWFCVDAFPALPQNHVNLHVNQEGDDEGNVEGHDRGVHNKGWIGNHTERLVTSSCERRRVDKNCRYSLTSLAKCFNL